ncbi:AMP-binding protein [Frankia sp. AgB1.9]|uniref:long-chain-fatty-acid--CoA ligase n=1 Tax=unclassified Frankia TaxID=2632575 RepID=UPI001932FFEA|nr:MULTISPECIES: long-chain-fatty-acid--CoA ligase [unclassified Frankia]MBL7494031.1 AMP-binding protein [Frankia sp. AgW1.1]MBL7547510.1 AMP-binding protein [Frankia sp. AgB1.9]MBL7619021.1 AMP-binding protein [Frankia sp. AgB1.8]
MVGLLDGFARAQRARGRITFLSEDDEQTLTWSELFAEAEQVAVWLHDARGIGPGDRVVLLGLPSRAVVTGLVGVWMAGASLTCAPTPARTVSVESYVGQTLARLGALGDPVVLVGAPYEDLAGVLTADGARVALLTEVLASSPAGVWKVPDLTDDDPAILQFTSGTTSDPKIVQVSHGNLAANIAAVQERLRHGEVHGRLLSWLPFSHDMGLIGALASQLTCGACDVLVGSPSDYLASPSSWMRNAARLRATVLMGPPSAYALAGRLLRAGPVLDLSCVRQVLSGGEPVDPEAIEGFLDAALRHGLRPETFVAAYGLAEATLAVTAPEPDRGLTVDDVDADTLAEHHLAVPARPGRRARRLTCLGPPLPGMQVRVVDPTTGADCAPRTVGEVQVAGPSVAGYLGEPPVDGWLATGDLGYLVDGDLVICGRAKDLIIMGGRNIHPEEVEQAATSVPGVRAGNAVAFATRRPNARTDSVMVVFELRPGHDEADVCARVTAAVLTTVGARPAAVRAVPAGSIPKTPSGKLQRADAARRWGQPL